MSVYTAGYLSGYLLVFFSLLALLLVIPEASAASHRIKPGWRAWVWPLAFLGLLVKNATESTALLQKVDTSSLLWQFGDLAACFSVTMLVLHSVHRVLDYTGAHRVTLIAWGIYFLFALAIFALSSVPVLLIYEVLCTVGLAVFYSMLYLRQRDRAADAPPALVGVSLLLLSALLNVFTFEISLQLITLNEVVVGHLVQVVAIFYLYKGASNSYSVKYAAQRRQERSQPILDRKI